MAKRMAADVIAAWLIAPESIIPSLKEQRSYIPLSLFLPSSNRNARSSAAREKFNTEADGGGFFVCGRRSEDDGATFPKVCVIVIAVRASRGAMRSQADVYGHGRL